MLFLLAIDWSDVYCCLYIFTQVKWDIAADK